MPVRTTIVTLQSKPTWFTDSSGRNSVLSNTDPGRQGAGSPVVSAVLGRWPALSWERTKVSWLLIENIFQNRSLTSSTYLERLVIWCQPQRWVCHCFGHSDTEAYKNPCAQQGALFPHLPPSALIRRGHPTTTSNKEDLGIQLHTNAAQQSGLVKYSPLQMPVACANYVFN